MRKKQEKWRKMKPGQIGGFALAFYRKNGGGFLVRELRPRSLFFHALYVIAGLLQPFYERYFTDGFAYGGYFNVYRAFVDRGCGGWRFGSVLVERRRRTVQFSSAACGSWFSCSGLPKVQLSSSGFNVCGGAA